MPGMQQYCQKAEGLRDKAASFRNENWRLWSEWRDSNSRHPGPKELMELFPNLFCSFLVLSAQVTMLSGTLQSAVSTCSRAVYGQKCGQNRFPQISGDCPPIQEAVFVCDIVAYGEGLIKSFLP